VDKEQKMEKLDRLIRHKREVLDNCILLAWNVLKEDGHDFDLARRLVAHGFEHDTSKLVTTIEWNHLTDADEDDDMLSVAIKEHNESNMHHPESWDGIKNMPQVYLAEMVCDWKARSSELGTDFVEWINEKATKRWGFTKRDKVYKDIMRFVNLLIERNL
jgi:hypothetical protein